VPRPATNLLSIAPYRFLPPANGGHLGIAMMHDHLGRLCEDHVATTSDNGVSTQWSFQTHPVLGTGAGRYIPFRQHNALKRLALKYDATAVFCEHPYMAATAHALASTLGIPFYLRSHNIESERFKTFGKRWWPALAAYEGWAMRHADGVFFVTPEDAAWAAGRWRLNKAHLHVAPYGTPIERAPEGHEVAKQELAQAWNLRGDVPWFYFLGALDYEPNVQALHYIIYEIIPRLQQSGQPFEVLVAGKGLSSLDAQRIASVGAYYTGFLPDLDQFLIACDVMLNPVILGGGIKTKAVEALAFGKRVVSVHSGAAGLIREACGDALTVVADGDWNGFASATLQAAGSPAKAPHQFYNTYYWGAVAKNVLEIIQRGH
jgi:glycosyltransferase involved in cell wall biosynthesis